MSDDPHQYRRALDHARAAEQQERALTQVRNSVEYPVPPLAAQAGLVLLLALAALLVLRNRRGYLSDWTRILLGVKRPLHSQSELRPKPSPLQPDARQLGVQRRRQSHECPRRDFAAGAFLSATLLTSFAMLFPDEHPEGA